MATPKVQDLDADLGFAAPLDEPTTTKTVKVFGTEIRVVCDVNTFGISNLTRTGAGTAELMDFMKSMIHPEDWDKFAFVAGQSPSLAGEDGFENLTKLVTKLMEVAAERPTTRPSALPRGGSTRSSGRKSAVRSSSAPAKA